MDGHPFEKRTSADTPAKFWAFNHPFCLLMNIAVGGYFPGAPDTTTLFPQKMLVADVRV